MEQTVEKIQEQLKVKGYTHFQEPVVDEEDGSTILVAFSGFTLTGNACLLYTSKGTITYAVHYTPGLHQAGRMKIEQDIRSQYKIPCGKR